MKSKSQITIRKNEYYNSKYDLSGTIKDLFTMVRNGYVTDSHQIEWILEQAKNETNCKIKTPCTVTKSIIEDLEFYLEDAQLRKEVPNVAYSIGELKLALKHDECIEDIKLSNTITLSIQKEGKIALVYLTDDSSDGRLEGGVGVPLSTIMKMNQYEFINFINNVYFYEVTEQEPEEREC